MKNLLIIIALIACLSACKKDVAANRHSPVGFYISHNLSSNLSPKNPANPYDSIGYLHNRLLSEIQPCVSSFSPVTEQEITGCIIPIAEKEGLNESGAQFYLAPLIVKDSENDFKNIIANSYYSPQTKMLLIQFVQTVKYVAINSNADYTSVKSSIVAFEAQISSNKSLSNAEKQLMLSVASVARYSLCYWHFLLPQQQALSLKHIVTFIGTALTDAVSLVVVKNVGFAVDSSEHAWWQMVYSIPGNM